MLHYHLTVLITGRQAPWKYEAEATKNIYTYLKTKKHHQILVAINFQPPLLLDVVYVYAGMFKLQCG